MPLTENEQREHLSSEDQLLSEVCNKLGVSVEMMKILRDIESKFSHLKRRHGLPEEMREVIRKTLRQDMGC